jgi:lysophospholipase L1-like esterase
MTPPTGPGAPGNDHNDDRGFTGTWATVPTGVPPGQLVTFDDQTIRQVVHLSIGGDAVRVRLSNEFGDCPLVIGEARLARPVTPGSGRDIVPGTDRRLTFGGSTTVTVPAGAPMLSDPVAVPVAAGSDLVVSLYLPQPTPGATVHAFPFQDNLVAPGNVTGRPSLGACEVLYQWYFLSGVSVHNPGAAAVVALGDSITDGANTTGGANLRWPDVLAGRLRVAPGLEQLAVLNAGICGNRLLHDPNPPPGSSAAEVAAFFGPGALRRFDRDVGAQPGARHLIVLLGVNDLGHPGSFAPVSERVSAVAIINAHEQLIARAHQRGLTAYGGTITPIGATGDFDTAGNEAARQEVNAWIRTGGAYDAVIDFDAALRDPARPRRLLAHYDSGDHLHPNDAGARALAEAVPLELFRRPG